MNERCAHETRKEAGSLLSFNFVEINFSCHERGRSNQSIYLAIPIHLFVVAIVAAEACP